MQINTLNQPLHTPAPMDSSHEPSSLLSTLEKHNDIVRAKLVPKLQANGSAVSCALVCTQLRQLCHGAQAKLRLAGSDCSDEHAIAQIPHFPSCTEVALNLDTSEDASIHLPAVLPAVLHLPAAWPALLGAVSQCQLGIRQRAMAGTGQGNAAHHIEGCIARQQVHCAATLEHLSALSSLSSLSSLTVDAERRELDTAQQYSWLQHLTSLTQLCVPLVVQHQGLASIGSCTNLRDLAFDVDGDPAFSQAECAAIAKLVQLTSFDAATDDAGSNPNFLSALGALSQLELLSVDGLSPASLPCLAGLSKLTDLQGTWQAGGASSSTPVVCNNITTTSSDGPIPFASFPLLKECYHWTTWDPADLKALAKSCKQLERFEVAAGCTGPSLSSDSPVRERTAAIQALAGLQHLTALSFGVNGDAEVAALAAIKQLKVAFVIVPPSSSCTAGLQGLQQLRGVQHLILELRGLSLSVQEAQALVCGMQHVGLLRVLSASEQVDVLRAALEAAQAAGLAVPAEVKLEAPP